ncbi:MAG: adenosylhomocysteinase, partial [Thermoplasmata archaeon]|nr:adenosylhomocysteinase [Thermoplasmata archaeon]
AHSPRVLVDDGCDLIKLAHEKGMRVWGASEETTTGIVRLRAMERDGVLEFPVMSANDAMMKHLFDNRYGTGQSTFDGIFTATNLLIAGKKFVVGGYGWCGRGIAMRAKGLGAEVIITEVDPIRAVEARLDGFQVMPMMDAAKQADFIVTAAGNRDLVTAGHLRVMKDGCVLANSGHFNNEINIDDLERLSKTKKSVRRMVESYTLEDGRTVYLIADGRLVNLAVGQGHPVEIMDMSFAIQALGVEYLVRNHEKMGKKVYRVPAEIDERVARLKLDAMGIKLDTLTPIQRDYLNSWEEGT